MPLIGLVRLRWALAGEIPAFDPIYPELKTGRGWATRKRRQAGNGLTTCHRVKVGKQSDFGGVSQERNRYRTGRLLRPW
jgi:hypothetical protein